MRVYSFINDQFCLRPVEVEVSLVPGLPDLKILGLPDAVIKESGERIKSAIKFQGFRWPKAQKILVQLKPSDLKKSSRGLDLAIATGILGEMGQLGIDVSDRFFYGELSLKGKVSCPVDAVDISLTETIVVTGKSSKLPFPSLQISELSQLEQPDHAMKSDFQFDLTRPEIEVETISEELAHLSSVVATGEHNSLIVGTPGTGKSTTAKIIATSLADPTEKQFRSSERIWRRLREKLFWRPIVVPHHTSSHIAIVGGGQPPSPGEITRAHGGVLILDELLEFRTSVQDALREPIETGKIRVSRSTRVAEFPSKFLLLATSNLCPCGNFIPEREHQCRCRTSTLTRYLEKFSGPILDRFEICHFAKNQNREGSLISINDIQTRAKEGREFARASRNQILPNSEVPISEIIRSFKSKKEEQVLADLTEKSSLRRKHSLVRGARSFADLERKESVRLSHIEAAKPLVLNNFKSLQQDVFRFV